MADQIHKLSDVRSDAMLEASKSDLPEVSSSDLRSSNAKGLGLSWHQLDSPSYPCVLLSCISASGSWVDGFGGKDQHA